VHRPGIQDALRRGPGARPPLARGGVARRRQQAGQRDVLQLLRAGQQAHGALGHLSAGRPDGRPVPKHTRERHRVLSACIGAGELLNSFHNAFWANNPPRVSTGRRAAHGQECMSVFVCVWGQRPRFMTGYDAGCCSLPEKASMSGLNGPGRSRAPGPAPRPSAPPPARPRCWRRALPPPL
jgi:hypothetical protein